jgi:hypothetical protein
MFAELIVGSMKGRVLINTNHFTNSTPINHGCRRRSESHQTTLQAGFLKKQLYLDQDTIRLNIWDTVSRRRHSGASRRTRPS